ncbi:MAG: radical SAM family protein [Armatimonadota bacterium]
MAKVPIDTELFIGAMTDAYPPQEKELGITRLILRELIAQRRPFCINTKSDLVCRDIDFLAAYQEHHDVCLSLCTLNEQALQALEPGAPTAAARLQALRQLHQAGIEVAIDASPWIPGISDADALIAVRPTGVTIQFAPLDIRHIGGSVRLLGRQLTQQEIDEAYHEERERLGEIAGVIWKDTLA